MEPPENEASVLTSIETASGTDVTNASARASLKLAKWPPADQARWLRVHEKRSLFDREAVLHGLKKPTIRGLEQAIGRFLAYVVHVREKTPDNSIGPTLTHELLNEYAGFMRERLRAGSVFEELRRLHAGLSILLPDHDLAWMNCLPLKPTQAEVVASRKPINRPDVARVVDASYRVFDAIPKAKVDTDSCRAARNCLIVAFAALVELRLADLTRIRLGEHLRCADVRWRLMFSDRVKNGAFLLFDVPPELAKRLEIYLATFRTALLGKRVDHGYLWVSRGGNPILQAAVARGINQFGEAHLGRKLNSHAFRHAFAVTMIVRNPSDAGLASAGLGHTSSQMVHGCYTQSGHHEISRLWLKKLAQRRKGR